MHGTYRSIESRGARRRVVRFARPTKSASEPSRATRRRALLAGCLLAGAGLALSPSPLGPIEAVRPLAAWPAPTQPSNPSMALAAAPVAAIPPAPMAATMAATMAAPMAAPTVPTPVMRASGAERRIRIETTMPPGDPPRAIAAAAVEAPPVAAVAIPPPPAEAPAPLVRIAVADAAEADNAATVADPAASVEGSDPDPTPGPAADAPPVAVAAMDEPASPAAIGPPPPPVDMTIAVDVRPEIAATVAVPAALAQRHDAPPAPEPAPRADVVAVAQIGERDRHPATMPQLSGPADGAASRDRAGIAYAADASQIGLPGAAGLTPAQRAALLTEAPAQLSLVVEGRRLGDVPIRTTAAGGFEIQLAGLLDILSDRFVANEYAALRGAPAAHGFVTIDQLNAAGIAIDYDPVYDELTLSA